MVQAREFKKKAEESMCESKEVLMQSMIQAALSNKSKSKNEDSVSEEDNEAITLGDFLEVLDGIIEVNGRIIIMTSNHPERLDPALLRPGRIDKIIEFKKMTKADIMNMYRLWFRADMPCDVQDALKDYTFSQADIGNIFACRDQEVIHKKLRS
jgi:SpoVK/Ycf46/Vps4 family AAA+-type ATPase